MFNFVRGDCGCDDRLLPCRYCGNRPRMLRIAECFYIGRNQKVLSPYRYFAHCGTPDCPGNSMDRLFSCKMSSKEDAVERWNLKMGDKQDA